MAVLAVIVSAQGEDTTSGGMTTEDIDGLFDNREPGTLISPAPTGTEEEQGGESDGSKILDMVANKEDVQKSIDWVQDLYNTLCGTMHEDGSKGEDGSEMHDETKAEDGT